MRIDNLSTNLYTNNIDSNNIDSSQQNQSQPLSDNADTQEAVPSSSYFENLSNLDGNFLAFRLKQETSSKQNDKTTNTNNPTKSTQKEEPKPNASQVTTKAVESGGKVNAEELTTKSWTDKGGKVFPNQNEYNTLILESVKDSKNPWPDFPPKILKSIIAQESGFDPTANDRNVYVGLTQMDTITAKSEGKLSFANGDPRTDPNKIVPATLRVLNAKSRALDVGFTLKNKDGKIIKDLPGFNFYGKPSAQDRIKFALAAYNVGQGKVLEALKSAYGDKIPKEVKYEDVEKFLRPLTQNYVKEIFERANKQ